MLGLNGAKTLAQTVLKACNPFEVSCKNIHTSISLYAWSSDKKRHHWLKYNETIYPPQLLDEERRPAFVCHMKENIKYSPWKMWYIATLVRGMSVDEALRQLKFVLKKGSADVAETIREAKELAITKHNVEYGSNLWVAESFVGKGKVLKGIRRHARGRNGKVEYFHCHYFVRLEEGSPPDHYYIQPKQPHEQLEDWLTQMRSRKIISSL